MYPSTNSTGKSASSIRQLMVRILRATLLREIAPSTESWMQSKVRNENRCEYVFISVVAPGPGIWCHREMCPSTYWWDSDLQISLSSYFRNLGHGLDIIVVKLSFQIFIYNWCQKLFSNNFTCSLLECVREAGIPWGPGHLLSVWVLPSSQILPPPPPPPPPLPLHVQPC